MRPDVDDVDWAENQKGDSESEAKEEYSEVEEEDSNIEDDESDVRAEDSAVEEEVSSAKEEDSNVEGAESDVDVEDSDVEKEDSDVEDEDSDVAEEDSGDDEEDSSVEMEDSDVEEADSDAEEMDSDIKDSVVERDSSDVEGLDSDNGEPAEFFGRRVSNNEGLNLGEPEEEEEVTFWLLVGGFSFLWPPTFSSLPFTGGLSLKSKQVQRPRFNGAVVSTLTILNRSRRLWGPTTIWLVIDIAGEPGGKGWASCWLLPVLSVEVPVGEMVGGGVRGGGVGVFLPIATTRV